ncbi:MAG TPA: SPOR domain-containing protein, partial [Gemmatimonadales bacterium]|nr:SPOR domain-containing protein [Gemmatimonadales bacterium]
RPQSGDSIWVIDAAADRLAGTAPGEWADDLPTVAGLSTLITRVGKDVVARNLAADGFPESGRVDGGAADLWTALAWTPKSDAAEVRESTATASGASDSAADTTVASAPTERVYLQVSSSQNGDWANQLMNQLRQAGLPASVLPPKRSDEPYRVVLGPYQSRADAEAAAETLGRPSFILQADSTTP